MTDLRTWAATSRAGDRFEALSPYDLIELSEEYAEIACNRIADVFRPVWIEKQKTAEQLNLIR